MTQLPTPPADAVVGLWTLLAIAGGGLQLRHTRGDIVLGEHAVASRAAADALVPSSALPVPRAHGDDARVIAAWIEVQAAWRDLVLSDPDFAAAWRRRTGDETPRGFGGAGR